MNTEIIKGQAQQTLELVAEIESLRQDKTSMEWSVDGKNRRILELENTVSAQSASLNEMRRDKALVIAENRCFKADIEAKNKEIKELIEAAKQSQEEESFMTHEYIDAMKEVTRLKGLLARNGIKIQEEGKDQCQILTLS